MTLPAIAAYAARHGERSDAIQPSAMCGLDFFRERRLFGTLKLAQTWIASLAITALRGASLSALVVAEGVSRKEGGWAGRDDGRKGRLSPLKA